MTVRSNPLLMFRQFVFSALMAACAANLPYLMLDLKKAFLLYFVPVFSMSAALASVVATGYARVTVDDGTVSVFRPFKKVRTHSLGEHRFSSREVVRSVCGVPVYADHILIAYNETKKHEIRLRNISECSFSALMNALRRTAPPPTHTISVSAASFSVPRGAILREYRKLMFVMGTAALALAGVIVWFFGYVTFCVAVLGTIAAAVWLAYDKRKKETPKHVAIDADSLTVDGDSFPLGDIRRVIASPPKSRRNDGTKNRTVAVRTDGATRRYNLGIREPGGVWGTAPVEYAVFCRSLETAALAYGFDLVYDV